MLGILYLLLCVCVGFCIVCLVFKEPHKISQLSYGGKNIKLAPVFFVFPTSLVLGTLVMSWGSYLFAYLNRQHSNSLTYANTIMMIAAALFIGATVYVLKSKLSESAKALFEGIKILEIIAFAAILVFITYLMFYTFRISGGKLYVGVTVFSDFSTHLDMIRSFSNGNNFPTTYSHFAGADIKYHFMFQFLAGNLEYLGMRLDYAFNIPSILFMFSVCMLIYTLTARLFAKNKVGFIAIFLFLFRSGKAFWNYLADINGTYSEIYKTASENSSFIGSTTNENWGLYNLNVYANQRHLSLGLCLILIAVILMIPNVCSLWTRIKTVGSRKNRLKETFISKKAWLIKDYKTCIFVGIMLGMGAFFNGACVIGVLMVLFVMALMSDRRLEYLVLAIIAVIFSYAQTHFFIDGSVMSLRWEPGYLSENKNVFATTNFYMTLLGVLPIVAFCAFLIVNKCYKWILLSFSLPLIFSGTFQMTVDTSVNHKYIMMSVMLLDVFIAGFIYWLFKKKDMFFKATSVLIIIAMTATGLYDFRTYIKANDTEKYGALVFDMDDPTTKWVMENSDSKDIFLTDWYSLNNIVLGGAMLYYGWPYFAWSAGYDTAAREEQVALMYMANNSDALVELVRKNNIRYIVVDNAARTSTMYRVNEAIIANTFELVYTDNAGSIWTTNIYDTNRLLNN